MLFILVKFLQVVSSFIATTSFALILSSISVLWLISKRVWCRDRKPRSKKEDRVCNLSIAELCESLVISCSDTQIFTGGAYALTLRYFKGCSIIAYHYDVVANMMLLTCATHLMSITIVRNYWKWPWLGLLRTLICTGVFIVTGILLANQNSKQDMKFPSYPPPANEDMGHILLPAACFQQGNSELPATLQYSLGEGAADAIFRSTPGNRIPGWNNYLIILLLYVIAAFVDILRYFRRGALGNPQGRRARVVIWLKTCGRTPRPSKVRDPSAPAPFFSLAGFIFLFFAMYLVAGIVVSAWTVWQSSQYIFQLRTWAKNSGWLQLEDGKQSAEDDATSFGQLVPIFLNVILLFTLAQFMSQSCTRFTNRKFDMYGGVIVERKDDDDSFDTQAHNISPSPTKPTATVQVHEQAAASEIRIDSFPYHPPLQFPSSPLGAMTATTPTMTTMANTPPPPTMTSTSPPPTSLHSFGRWENLTQQPPAESQSPPPWQYQHQHQNQGQSPTPPTPPTPTTWPLPAHPQTATPQHQQSHVSMQQQPQRMSTSPTSVYTAAQAQGSGSVGEFQQPQPQHQRSMSQASMHSLSASATGTTGSVTQFQVVGPDGRPWTFVPVPMSPT